MFGLIFCFFLLRLLFLLSSRYVLEASRLLRKSIIHVESDEVVLNERPVSAKSNEIFAESAEVVPSSVKNEPKKTTKVVFEKEKQPFFLSLEKKKQSNPDHAVLFRVQARF